MLQLSLYVIGDRLGLDSSCVRIANREAKKFQGVRIFDKKQTKLRPGFLYVIDPEDVTEAAVSSAQCGFALTAMPSSSMGNCDYLYMDLRFSKAELLGQLLSIYERLGDWVLTFQNRLIGNADVDRLPEAISGLIQHPFYIVDTSFKVLAFSQHPEMKEISVSWRYFWKYKYLPLDLVERMRASGDIERMKNFTTATFYRSANFNHPFVVYTLRSGGRAIGFLFIIGMYQNVTAGDIELTDLVGGLIDRYMSSSEIYTRTNGLVHEGFFRDVLRGTLTNDELIRNQLHAFGWQEQDVFCILRAEMDCDDFRKQRCFAEDLTAFVDARSVYYEDALLSILHLPAFRDYEALCVSLREYVRKMHCLCAISEPFSGFKRLPGFCYQVSFLPDRAEAGGELRRFREHMADYLFHGAAALPADVTSLCIQNLFDIRRYDSENNTAFFQTLREYLRHERSLVDTAQSLYIHRNTLIHRLEKLTALFGELGLDDADIRLALLLSFQIAEGA